MKPFVGSTSVERRAPPGERTDQKRPWLATRLALGFVAVVLVFMLLVPLLIRQRLDALREETATVAEPAREATEAISRALAVEVASERGFQLTGRPWFRQRFVDAWTRQEHALDTVSRLAPRIGGLVEERADALRQAVHAWGELPLRALNGQAPRQALATQLEPQERLFERTVAAATALDDEIYAAAQRRRDAATRMATVAAVITASLSALALLALLVVTWLARLLRQVAREEAEMREQLQALFAARDRLIRGFSHDIKNPLGAADGFAELMQLGIIREPAAQGRALERIRRSIATALHLIEDVLELARAEAGQLQFRFAPVDLLLVADEIADDYRAQAAAAGMEITVDVADNLPALHSDQARIHQILGNLVSNAIKYARCGGAIGLRIRCAARWPGSRVADWLRIEVWDRGPGISSDSLERVFEEFTRLEPERDVDGAGLGLAISRRLARALGGELTVESSSGQGARFILWLPVAAAAAA